MALYDAAPVDFAAEDAALLRSASAPPPPRRLEGLFSPSARDKESAGAEKATAAAAATETAAAPEKETWEANPHGCPVCHEDWDVNGRKCFRACCCRDVCGSCAFKLDRLTLGVCAICRTAEPADDAETVARLNAKVAADNPDAAARLADCYVTGGLGLDRNYAKAVDLYERAVAGGHVDALTSLASLYVIGGPDKKPRPADAIRLYTKAADLGDPAGLLSLGQCYHDGYGVDRDDAEAARLWRRAAQMNLAAAQFNLGCLYANGEGVGAVDLNAALDLCERATKSGNKRAKAAVTVLRDALRGAPATKSEG